MQLCSFYSRTSSLTIPNSTARLNEYGITHVLSLTSVKDCPNPGWQDLGIEHLLVDIEDNPYEDILICLDGLCAWIDHTLGRGSKNDRGKEDQDANSNEHLMNTRNHKVLVHCVQGFSRSGAIIVAYLMRSLSMSYDTVLALAREYRPSIAPNSGFAEQLRLWQQLEYRVINPKSWPDLKMKDEYETCRDNRGILLSKTERNKREMLFNKMIELMKKLD